MERSLPKRSSLGVVTEGAKTLIVAGVEGGDGKIITRKNLSSLRDLENLMQRIVVTESLTYSQILL
jgi:hypothetical protein